MSPEAISAILTGLVAVIGAIGTVMSIRTRRVERNQREDRAELRRLHRQLLLAERYIARLARQLARHDLPVPDPPEGFGDDTEDELDPQPPPSPRHRGSRGQYPDHDPYEPQYGAGGRHY